MPEKNKLLCWDIRTLEALIPVSADMYRLSIMYGWTQKSL